MPYTWIEIKDNDAAVQMGRIGANMGIDPYKTMLGLSPADTTYWVAHAAQLVWLQLTVIPAVDAYKQSLVGTRDRFTHGPDLNPFLLPTLSLPPTPTVPAGVTLMDDSFDWANARVKAWKANPKFTPELQGQMGLVVPVSSAVAALSVKDVALVRSVKAQSGGVLTVDVFKGSSPLVTVQLNVHGTGWPELNTGGVNQKTLASSRFEFQVPAGAAHSVQIRECLMDKSGHMVGDWSAVKTTSSLA